MILKKKQESSTCCGKSRCPTRKECSPRTRTGAGAVSSAVLETSPPGDAVLLPNEPVPAREGQLGQGGSRTIANSSLGGTVNVNGVQAVATSARPDAQGPRPAAEGYQLYTIDLRLENQTAQPVNYELSDFILVDRRGNAYVNAPNFDMSQGFDFELGSKTGVIALVTSDGEARIVADEVAFPNGMAVTADGSTLIVGESFASRLGAWDIEPDGGLSNRRVWAWLEHGVDGISIDAEGAVWCATQKGCARVREGGEVLQTIPHDRFGFSCALGGPDGRTLYMVAAEWNGPEHIGEGPRTGVVYAARVDVPGVAR